MYSLSLIFLLAEPASGIGRPTVIKNVLERKNIEAILKTKPMLNVIINNIYFKIIYRPKGYVSGTLDSLTEISI